MMNSPKSNKTSFECSKCEKKYQQKRSLNQHVAYFHEEQKFITCSICNVRFTFNGSLKTHIEYVHDKRLFFKCSICGVKLTRQ